MPISYRNGEFTSEEVTLSLRDAGHMQGVVAVERLRTYGGRLFRVDDHFARLRRSVDGLGFSATGKVERLQDSLPELCDRNREWIDRHHEFGMQVVVTPGIMDAKAATAIATVQPLDLERFDRLASQGEQLVVTSVRQPDPDVVPRHVKSRSRVHYFRANQVAQAQAGSFAQGVLVDQDGSITETASANILVVQNGVIVSPPRDRILPGVTLGVVWELCEQLGIRCVEKSVTPDAFRNADEILLTGTGPGIWYGNGLRGPIFERLSKAFRKMTETAALK